jgi:hypothetical protein
MGGIPILLRDYNPIVLADAPLLSLQGHYNQMITLGPFYGALLQIPDIKL